MQISVRSHLTAGMAAVVGAGAIAMTPVVIPTNSALSVAPVATVADVQLAAFSFSDVLGVLQTLGLGGALPDISSLIPSNLITATVSEFVNEATPLVTGAAGDVLGYLTSAITGLIVGSDSVLARIIGAVGNIPTVVTTAIQALSTGNIAGAISTVVTGLIAPVTAIGQAVTDAVQAFQAFVATKLSTVAAGLPGLLLNSVQVVMAGNLGSLGLFNNAQTAITNWIINMAPVGFAAARVAAVPAAAAAAAVAAPTAVAATVVAPRAAARHAAAAGAGAAVSAARSHVAAPDSAAAAPKSASAPRAVAARHAARAAAAASAE